MIWNVYLVISLSVLLGSGLALGICLYELIREIWGHQAPRLLNYRYVAIMLGLGVISLSGTVYGLVTVAVVTHLSY